MLILVHDVFLLCGYSCIETHQIFCLDLYSSSVLILLHRTCSENMDIHLCLGEIMLLKNMKGTWQAFCILTIYQGDYLTSKAISQNLAT